MFQFMGAGQIGQDGHSATISVGLVYAPVHGNATIHYHNTMVHGIALEIPWMRQIATTGILSTVLVSYL